MSVRRVALLGTFIVVAGLAIALTVLRWDEANKVAAIASALAAVAAVGVAIWAALPVLSKVSLIQISRTGKAKATFGGKVNTGISGPVRSVRGNVKVDRTGDADASGDGEANTGVWLN